MKYKLLLILGLLVNQFYGQINPTTLKIIDSETKKKLPYANITGKENYLGQTDENGFFTVQKKDLTTITISHIGYDSITIKLNKEANDTLVINLNQNNLLLEEVIITSKKDSVIANTDPDKIKWYAKKFTKLYLGYLQMAKVHEERATYIADDMVAFLECNSFLIPSTKTVRNSMLTAIPKSHARLLVNPKFKNWILSRKSFGFLLSSGHFYDLRRYLDYNPMLLKNFNNYTYKIISEDENTIRVKYNYRRDKKLNLMKRINGVLTINKKSNLLEQFSYVCNLNYDDLQTRNSATIFFQNNDNSIYCSGGKSEYIDFNNNMCVKHSFDLLSNYGPNTFVKDDNIMSYNLKDFTSYDLKEWKSFPIKNSMFLSDILTFSKNSILENEFKLGAQYLIQLNENLKGNLKIEQEALNNVVYPKIIKQVQTKLKIEL